jgi:NADH-quinone oxidoreductase subunit G
MIEIEIDGKKLTVAPGTSIIEAADQAGIYIPRFCYHEKLSVAANCRMCLVEVDQVGKPLPACATPVAQNMTVYTQSQKARDAQKAVMEFLLINHPLDCPICDQGGACELQDLAMGYGAGQGAYTQAKRAVDSVDIGPLIETEMTRCIHCTRCVRFGEEVAGMTELGVVGRGEHAEISTYISEMVTSELSGNVIDLCPVGALTAKPSRYQMRDWELREYPAIAPHDCVGSHVFVQSKTEESTGVKTALRVVPRAAPELNDVWLSDRDRFSLEGLGHQERCLSPMVKQPSGEFKAVSWQEALRHAAEGMQRVLSQQGPDSVAVLSDARATCEEQYMLQAFLRNAGGSHIDMRVREQDFSDSARMSALMCQTQDALLFSKADVIVLCGSHIRSEQPILGQHMRQAAAAGASIFMINPVDYRSIFSLTDRCITFDFVKVLSDLQAALANPEQASAEMSQWASALREAKTPVLALGSAALNHPHASTIRRLALQIATDIKGNLQLLTEGPNTHGAHLVGAVPHCGPGQSLLAAPSFENAKTLLTTQSKQAYCLFDLEVAHDVAYAAEAIANLQQAEHVVCFATFLSDTMKQYADVVLPIAAFTENAGTFVNVMGRVQAFEAAASLPGEVRQGWQAVRALSRAMGQALPETADFSALQSAVHLAIAQGQAAADSDPVRSDDSGQSTPVASELSGLHRLGLKPVYHTDPLVRRAAALQQTALSQIPALRMHPQTAAKLGLIAGQQVVATQGASRYSAEMTVDDTLAEAVVWIPAGLPDTSGFGVAFGEITVTAEG